MSVSSVLADWDALIAQLDQGVYDLARNPELAVKLEELRDAIENALEQRDEEQHVGEEDEEDEEDDEESEQ